MKIKGNLTSNLQAALQNAKRLQSKHVYAGTLQYWRMLVDEAQRAAAAQEPVDRDEIQQLSNELEAILTSRTLIGGRPGNSNRGR